MINQLHVRGNKLSPTSPLFTCHMHMRHANLPHTHLIYMKDAQIYSGVVTVKRKAIKRKRSTDQSY